ncbi:patched domain-containing protein 3-like [Pomacea canaliculata]|uniref:patched domain-containing protein 3-like n=1 Tax=Pomacea canaliculata TaxID=400727 RepID=UPI000D737197|nr:patched domain-containing protein 3-like [Pomacea canaliculata]
MEDHMYHDYYLDETSKIWTWMHNCLQKASTAIVQTLEMAFFRIGHFVGEYPVLTIVLTLTIFGLCGIGLKTLSPVNDQAKLWVPKSSRIVNEKAWVDQTFPDKTRFVSILLESTESVLTPKCLKAMMAFYDRAVAMNMSGTMFPDFCVGMLMGPVCRVSSLLELWNYNSSLIASLTHDQIISKINTVKTSHYFGWEISTLLGGYINNTNGNIVEATATQMTFVTRQEEKTEEKIKEWEKKVIELVTGGHPDISALFVYASRSFDDEGYGAVNNDITLLTAGFSIVFAFVLLSLGKFNLTEHKIYVSMAGIMCIGLAILFAYGLATALDVMYSPIQTIMPFMLLGVGVDDMFIVLEVWKNLSPEENNLPVPQKIATTLKHAGVSITVTSLTDAVAFGVGASTVIPALSSFCIFAVLGILGLFILVATFFSACLTLDEKRRRAGLDACIVCCKHRNYMPNKCSQGASFLHIFFSRLYAPVLMTNLAKVLIIIASLVVFSVNLWSFSKMKTEFSLASYIPSDSYAFAYFQAKRRLFNSKGEDTAVYCGEFSYLQHSQQLENLHLQISSSSSILNGTINAWFIHYHKWLSYHGYLPSTEQEYVSYLHRFLGNSTAGQTLRHFIIFDNDLSPSVIKASYFTLQHVMQPDTKSGIAAMDSLISLIDNAGLPLSDKGSDLPKHKCFAYSLSYLTYETNRVLHKELLRNLAMSGACVLVVTTLLIADLWTSTLVFLCVIFTVVDVAGSLQFWGTYIDTASSILLTLTVGLAVDYSAHIGHTFMTVSGSRTERTVATLTKIGPAVFNGGFSTFLAFVLLANSSSYGFVVFFRVFFTVVVFGLFHGLALLPVMLSLVGSSQYLYKDPVPKPQEMTVILDGAAQKNDTSAFRHNTRTPNEQFGSMGHHQVQKMYAEVTLSDCFIVVFVDLMIHSSTAGNS